MQEFGRHPWLYGLAWREATELISAYVRRFPGLGPTRDFKHLNIFESFNVQPEESLVESSVIISHYRYTDGLEDLGSGACTGLSEPSFHRFIYTTCCNAIIIVPLPHGHDTSLSSIVYESKRVLYSSKK